MWKKVKLLRMSNFTFFNNVFYAIYILNSFNSHILVVVCSFFEFGTVSIWCVREWVKINWVRKSIIGKLFFFFQLEIFLPAVTFYWRNDTCNLCNLTVFIPKSVRPQFFRPLAFPDLLVHYIIVYVFIYLFYLFIIFSNYQFLKLAPLTNVTPALSTLWSWLLSLVLKFLRHPYRCCRYLA